MTTDSKDTGKTSVFKGSTSGRSYTLLPLEDQKRLSNWRIFSTNTSPPPTKDSPTSTDSEQANTSPNSSDNDRHQAEINRVVDVARSGETRVALSEALIESLIGFHEEITSVTDLGEFVHGIGGLRLWALEQGLPIEESLTWKVKTLRDAMEGACECEAIPMVELHVLTGADGDQRLVLGNYSANQTNGYPGETIGVYPDRKSMEADLRQRGIVDIYDVSDEYLSSWLIQNDGPFETYYENGQLQEKSAYNDGEWDGPYEYCTSLGQIIEKGTYNMGERCGEWIQEETGFLGSKTSVTVTFPPCPPRPRRRQLAPSVAPSHA